MKVSFTLAITLVVAGCVALHPTGAAGQSSQKVAGESRTFSLPGGASMEMVWIPAGSFMMGSPLSEVDRYNREGPQHQVTISKGYWLGKYEVTQTEWKLVMGRNPSKSKGPNRPVEKVSWKDVQSFIEKLNHAVGNQVYRLPTEAEWEYACRAGTTSRWSFGDDERQLGEYAWYIMNSLSHSGTRDVGLKSANDWGLYDMHGNVSEWCQDRYGIYSNDSQHDPMGVSTGSDRVIKGGGFCDAARYTRSANRDKVASSVRSFSIGFRLLRTE